MMFLDILNKFSRLCPVCMTNTSVNLVIQNLKGNSYHYSLSNKNYPLIFKSAVDIGDYPHSVIINGKDNLILSNFSYGINKVEIDAACGSHYRVLLLKRYSTYTKQGKGHEGIGSLLFVNPSSVSETVYLSDYTIQNFHSLSSKSETFVFKSRTHPREDKFLILRMPLKDINYWPFSDKNKMIEKINKYVLLV